MGEEAAVKRFFTEELLKWNKQNRRKLPWKGEKDPYKIWLSEIILQQTRTGQGQPYYERFIRHYPGVRQLAAARDEQVFRLWQGLGYYNRCKHMLAAARQVVEEHNGIFPSSYEALLSLKGVGVYTAAAIASFAFDLPYAVVDGNVYRLLSRFFGIETAIDGTEGRKLFSRLADELIDASKPAAYNQAIMDFGATVCKPQQPLCDACPLKSRCRAAGSPLVARLPVKGKRVVVRSRYFHYIVLCHDQQVYIRERTGKDIWQHLHEFLLLETPAMTPAEQALRDPSLQTLPARDTWQWRHTSGIYRHQLTHQTLFIRFSILDTEHALTIPGYFPVKTQDLRHYALPRVLEQYVQECLTAEGSGN